MKIKELSIEEFEGFANRNPLYSYMQTEAYAHLMYENKYTYDFIGLINESNQVCAASLILLKKLNMNISYGYAPKGFLINYYDSKLLETFTNLLKEYYIKRNVAFIKVNPEIVVSEVDNKTFEFKYNVNKQLKQDIQKYGFTKLKDNLYFESINPRFNAYVDLKNSNIKKYSKANRNKVKNSRRKGLYVQKGTVYDLDEFCTNCGLKDKLPYYKSMLNIFKNEVDLILVRVNFEEFIRNSQNFYDEELERNNLYNEILHRSNKEEDLHRKMDSDTLLATLKKEIVVATEGLRDNNDALVAGAIVIKSKNRAHVIESSYDKKFAYLNANYFLYDSLINNYKSDFDYLDIGGISGDFKETSPYRGLNRFKLGFDAKIYEYIGEYDFVINKTIYEGLLLSGRLASEFKKKIKR